MRGRTAQNDKLWQGYLSIQFRATNCRSRPHMSVCRFKEKRKKIKEAARTKTPLEPGKSSKKHT